MFLQSDTNNAWNYSPDGSRGCVPLDLKPHILIVDDNEALASTLDEIFDEEGIESKVALDAKQAMVLIQKHNFDIALVDIKLPGMQGDELVSQLLKIKPELACIFMI